MPHLLVSSPVKPEFTNHNKIILTETLPSSTTQTGIITPRNRTGKQENPKNVAIQAKTDQKAQITQI